MNLVILILRHQFTFNPYLLHLKQGDVSVLVSKCTKVWLFMCICSYIARVKDTKFDIV